jgi:hypothetical protein
MVFKSRTPKVERLIYEAIAVGIIEVAFIIYLSILIVKESKK